MIGDKEILIDKNEDGHYRGIHLVIIDPSTGEKKYSEVFDTYKSSDKFDTFIDNQHLHPEGFIVAAACKDECVTNLSKKAKKWFSDMGS